MLSLMKYRTNMSPRVGQVSTLHFEIRNLPSGLQIRTEKEAAAALGKHFVPAANYLVLINRETLIVGCESTDRNRVLKAIYDDLKRGAESVFKTRPALIACQLEDIEDNDWNQLQGETGLAAMTGQPLPKRPIGDTLISLCIVQIGLHRRGSVQSQAFRRQISGFRTAHPLFLYR